jgi:hypothetical protein
MGTYQVKAETSLLAMRFCIFEENGKRLTYEESLQRALDELEKSLEEAGESYYLTFQQEK